MQIDLDLALRLVGDATLFFSRFNFLMWSVKTGFSLSVNVI